MRLFHPSYTLYIWALAFNFKSFHNKATRFPTGCAFRLVSDPLDKMKAFYVSVMSSLIQKRYFWTILWSQIHYSSSVSELIYYALFGQCMKLTSNGQEMSVRRFCSVNTPKVPDSVTIGTVLQMQSRFSERWPRKEQSSVFRRLIAGFLLGLTASVVQWSEFLAIDPEARVRFPELPEKKLWVWNGVHLASWVQLRSYFIEK
jgi:hypothetical protein